LINIDKIVTNLCLRELKLENCCFAVK